VCVAAHLLQHCVQCSVRRLEVCCIRHTRLQHKLVCQLKVALTIQVLSNHLGGNGWGCRAGQGRAGQGRGRWVCRPSLLSLCWHEDNKEALKRPKLTALLAHGRQSLLLRWQPRRLKCHLWLHPAANLSVLNEGSQGM